MSNPKRVLALDYGKKRIGVAGGDMLTRIAFPREVLINKGFEYIVAEVQRVCDEWNVELVLIGLPLNMNEEEGEMAGEARNFAAKLGGRLRVAVRLFDERLSSFEADELMRKAGITDSGERKMSRDSYSAQIILQRFFDTNAD